MASVYAAAAHGRVDLLKRYYDLGNVVVDKRYHLGHTTLCIAARLGHLDAVNYLLEQGESILVKNNTNNNALSVAVVKGHTEILKTLLYYSSQVDLQETFGERGYTLLGIACLLGREDVLEILLKCDANPNEQGGSNGETPLTCLITESRQNAAAMRELLLEHGANPDLADSSGHTPLFHAIQNGLRQCAYQLLCFRANVNVAASWSVLPLACAITLTDPAMVKMLLRHGACLYLRGPDGTRPVDLQMWGLPFNTREDIRQAAVAEWNSNPNASVEWGDSPSHM